jgi:hypothetical protein
MMVKRVMEWARQNWPTAVVVFKVFWIIVFVVDALQSSDVTRIPQFVYVNY